MKKTKVLIPNQLSTLSSIKVMEIQTISVIAALIKKLSTEVKSVKKRKNKMKVKTKVQRKETKRRRSQLLTNQLQNQDLKRIKMKMILQLLIKWHYGLKTCLTCVAGVLVVHLAILIMIRNLGMI
jgi:hypothetical protein